MKNYLLLIAACVLFGLQGCADLQHVNSFSNTAVKTIKSYDEIGYTFTKSYYTYTLGQNAYQLTGNIDANSLSVPAPIAISNEPQTANKADQAITFFTAGIASYFEALAKLSDKDLVNYNFDDVGKNLKADATLKAKFGIDDSQIDATAKIATAFTNMVMGVYRERKIRKVMIEYDADVSKSTQALIDILTNAILPTLKADNGLIEVKYQVILKNPKIDLSKKAELTNSYNDEKITLDKYKTQIEQLVKALTTIKDEHNKTVVLLKDSKLTAKAVKDIINQHSAEVYLIYTNIKALTSN